MIGRGVDQASSESINRILICEKDDAKAVVMANAMDIVLKRAPVVLSNTEFVDAIIEETCNTIERLEVYDVALAHIYSDIRGALKERRSTFIGMAGRKLREAIINNIINDSKQNRTQEEEYKALSSKRVADWIIAYLNLLRRLGNESAHDKNLDRFPSNISQGDLILCLFAIQRVLNFWMAWCKSAGQKTNSAATGS